MTIVKFSSKQPESEFFKDIEENGYHIFSQKNAQKPDYYPNEFLDYPGVSLKQLKLGDEITVRVFFKIGDGENVRADGGYLDLKIEGIADDHVMAEILTKLPPEFALGACDSIELFEDEILRRNQSTEH